VTYLEAKSTTTIEPLDGERFRRMRRAIRAFARGELLVVSDDEDRENEGDLVVAADHADAAAINFMVSHGRGLVCLAVAPEIAARKKLRPMVERNQDDLGTAFTVSVDGRREYGITTGISAGERSRTIELLISDDFGPEALSSPGHMFPLIARPGGLRERQGHTEAGVELARLAGLRPAAAIVEIMRADGEMARRPELLAFSARFKLHYITIEDLRAYIEARERPQAVPRALKVG
jgi:3,4-dihydroxy-2-butanone 4-phosphate synthase